jgi:hypothetical protein
MPAIVAKLTKLVLELDEKSRAVERLKQIVDQLEKAKVNPTEGERWLLDALEPHSRRGRELLESITKTTTRSEYVPLVRDLEDLLSQVQWELLDEVMPKLRQQMEAQEARVREYGQTLVHWRTYLDTLRRDLSLARNEGIPLIADERFLFRLDGLVTSLDRAVQEQNLLTVPGLIREIEKGGQPDELRSEKIQARVKNKRSYALQADLLLLRPPLNEASDMFEYTVLLRTPSRPGSHGVNIQGTSTIVKADRDRLVSLFGKITKAFNSSVQRGAEATPQARPSPPEPVSLDANQMRDFYWSTSAIWNASAGNPNALLREVGDFMFRIFMPEQIVQFLKIQACSLTLTTNDLELPWELMLTGDSAKGDKFLCLERPVARLPMGYVVPRLEFPEPVPRTKKYFLFIYSDPEQNLPGAKREIERIRSALEQQWKGDVEIESISGDDATGDRLNEVLRANRFDVIHYAGHAAFQTDKPDLSALMLTKREPFFAQKIRRLLKGRPLVFLNACESAATANPQNPQQAPEVRYELQEAEGLAAAFIYGGALGCLGAIWPVFDTAAADFAVAFYNKVLEGEMIGEAVRHARLQVQQSHAGITWASFTLYGDPTFRVFT